MTAIAVEHADGTWEVRPYGTGRIVHVATSLRAALGWAECIGGYEDCVVRHLPPEEGS